MDIFSWADPDLIANEIARLSFERHGALELPVPREALRNAGT